MLQVAAADLYTEVPNGETPARTRDTHHISLPWPEFHGSQHLRVRSLNNANEDDAYSTTDT